MSVTKMPNDLREERLLQAINRCLEKPSDEAYGHAIALWLQLIETPDFRLKPDHFSFIFTCLLPSALKPELRLNAIKGLNVTVPLLQDMEYRNHPKYKEFLEKSISTYMPKVKEEIDKIPEWALIWCLFLTVVRNDMARSIQINAFLSVAESGFRSSNIEMRTKSFRCWRKLIEIYASEGQLQHRKRVRLIAVPLQTTASKSLDLATAKFGCWWYLVNSISPEASEDHTKCFIHFLNFCFGPLNDLPLEGYIKNSTAVSPGKLYNELKLTVIVALIRVLGPSIPLIGTLKLDRPMDDLKAQFSAAKVFPICRREIIHCCAEATILLYSLRKLPSETQSAITKNIWDNLFALIKHDDKLTKSIVLVMAAVTAMVNISRDPQHRAIAPCIPTVFEAIKAAKFSLKGAQVLTEFSLNMLTGLNAATKAMERRAIEEYFDALVVAHFQTIHMLDNKVLFVVALAKEVMSLQKKSSFVIWSLVWTKVVCVLEKSIPIQAEFVKFGLENHFNEMIQEKEAWIFNWGVLPNNQYLNQVALLFQAAAKDEAASYNIVEVVTCMLNSTADSFYKTTVPREVLRLFNQQMERFVSTEFATTFVDSLNVFLKKVNAEQFPLLLDDLNCTLKVLRKCSKSLNSVESFVTLRGILLSKCSVIETSSQDKDKSKAFYLMHQDWLKVGLAAPGSASKKMPQPLAPPKRKAEEEFVPIKRDWSFDPKNLTDHQIERMKERRDDIPALYNDNSQSQDTRSLQPWALKTTPAAESKESKPDISIFAAVVGAQANGKQPPPTEGKSSHDVLDTSRSDTPTKTKKVKNELSRLAIDTVEGNCVFDGDKKTRQSRRGSMEIRAKDASPRKSSAPAEKVSPAAKLKSRRATIGGDVKNERSLKPVPEADSTPVKGTAAGIPKESPATASKVNSSSLIAKESPVIAVAKGTCASIAKITPATVLKNSPATASKSVPPSNSKANPTTVAKESPVTVTTATKAIEAPTKAAATTATKSATSTHTKGAPSTATKVTPPVTVIKESPATFAKTILSVNDKESPVTVDKGAPSDNGKVVTLSVASPASYTVIRVAPPSAAPKEEALKRTALTDASKAAPTTKEHVSTPMVTIPAEEPVVKPAPAQILKARVTIPETIPEKSQEVTKESPPVPEAASEPMDVGSESFVEEMNLAVSANTSVNLQRSIVSSPEDLDNADERESTFLNDTINISPILKVAVTAKEATTVAPEAPRAIDPKLPEIMTTPKRSNEVALSKENNPAAISTTPHSFSSKLTGRGAQMLQQTKLFQESTPKEKAREEPVINKEDTLARMMVKTVPCRSSPSTSILRRKRLEEDMDDTVESPAAKKKKVSFSDPPVSATKEFIRDSERSKSNTLARMLMRRSRTDSASELNSLNVNYNGGGASGGMSGGGGGLAAGVGGSDSDDETDGDRRPMPMDDSKIFEYLQKKYTEGDEDEAPPKLPLSQIRTLTEVLLHSIAHSAPAKEEFFQKLMLAMPKDALHWSVKENSSYAFLTEVKDQVSPATFINYTINLLKTDSEFHRKMTGELGLRMDAAQTLDLFAAIMARKPPA